VSDWQTSEAFASVFGERFLRIYSISFSRGSVLVNSIIQLTGTVSDDEEQRLSNNTRDVFASNGFLIDRFSFESTNGN